MGCFIHGNYFFASDVFCVMYFQQQQKRRGKEQKTPELQIRNIDREDWPVSDVILYGLVILFDVWEAHKNMNVWEEISYLLS